MPAYNCEKYIEAAIRSVMAQTCESFELLVIDDGSKDDTFAIARRLAAEDARVTALKNPENMGVARTRNRGLDMARGEYVAFLDSDDEWMSKKLELQLAFFREQPQFNIIHGEEIWIRNGVRVNPCEKFRKSGGDIFNRSVNFSLIAPSAVMAKREIFDKCGVFDESLPVCEDYDLWLRIMLSGEEFGFISTPLVTRYAGHSGQLSTRYEAMDRFRAQSLYKLLQTIKMPPDKYEIMQKTLHKKAQILLKGAEKRSHYDDVKIFQSYLDF